MIVNAAFIQVIDENFDRSDSVDIRFSDGHQVLELASELTAYGDGSMLVNQKLQEIAEKAKENESV